MTGAHHPSVHRWAQWSAAGAGVACALTLAVAPGHWPFDQTPPAHDPSLWPFLLGDRLTLGFVRLSVVLLSLFVIASVPALFAAGRWMRSLGAGGMSADDVDTSAVLLREIERLRAELREARETRSEAANELQTGAGNDTQETTEVPHDRG